MGGKVLADTEAQIRRLQPTYAPPVIPEVFSGETRLIGRWRNEPFEYDLPPLEHHIIAATYVGTGSASVQVGSQTISAPAKTGMVTIWPSGHDGRWRASGAIETSTVFLGRARLQACADQVGRGHQPELRFDRLHFGDPKLFALMNMMNAEINSGDAISHLFLEHLVDLVCLQLLRTHGTTSTPISPAPRKGLSARQVKRVTAYMRENLASSIRLQELADLVNLSRFHFCSTFRMATGFSPHEWLMRQRMSHAKALLRDETLRITDIALIVGYETPSAFSATFRKMFGHTPSEYRARL